MNDDSLQDLKQFISTTVHKEVSDVREEVKNVRHDIKKLDNKLSSKIDDLSESVATALDTTNETTDAQLKEYGKRITKLEHKVA